VTRNTVEPLTGKRTARQILGQAGEDSALDYLGRNGLTLVERNFRCRGGEIDLVMQHGDVLVFVEVRKRADNRYGGAAASVTAAKQARLMLAAQIYLQRYRSPPACRFDVVAIDGSALTWLKNAIQA
jgi:putative endonuclease